MGNSLLQLRFHMLGHYANLLTLRQIMTNVLHNFVGLFFIFRNRGILFHFFYLFLRRGT